MTFPSRATLIAALGVAFVLSIPSQALALQGVQLGSGSAQVRATAPDGIGPDQDGDGLAFSGSVSESNAEGSAGATADLSIVESAQSVRFDFNGTATTEATGIASSAFDRAFTVSETVPYRFNGQAGPLDDPQVVFFGFLTQLTCQGQCSGALQSEGTLEPGTYRAEALIRCQGNPSESCDASVDMALELGNPGPSVTISTGPSGTVASPDARFEFETTDPGPPPGRFECRLDGQGADPFTPCASPLDISDLAPGEHLFEVRYHPDGEDPGPVASRDWTVSGECPDVQVGFARAKGCFTETAPDSGKFETDERAWVGGFEVVPRSGGKLVLDTKHPDVSTSGAGADVVFAGFRVPVPVGALPVDAASGSFSFGGGTGTAAKVLGIPVEASVKVAWTDGGRSAAYEQKVAIKKLTESIGPLVTPPGTAIGDAGGTLKAKLQNGVGFVLQQGEVRIDKVTLLPDKLKVKRQLGLRDLLLRFERKDGKPFWTGRGGITFPLARGDLGVTATAFAFDGSLAGGGLAVDGINKQLGGTPLFLQSVSGDLLFAPRFGHDLGVKGSLGPRVNGKQLLTIAGQMKGGELIAPSDCPSGDDPEKLVVSSKFTPLEPLELAGLASSQMSLRGCTYPYNGLPPAMDVTGEIGIDLAGGALAYTSSQTGFVSDHGVNLEGAATLKIPGGSVGGRAIVSTLGTAACANVGFFDAGFGYRWGEGTPSAFSGCDLGRFRVLASAAGSEARVAGTGAIEVPKGLPHAGFAATAAGGPPPIKLSGPGGIELSSPPDGSVLRTPDALIVPVADESTTYAFVRKPRAGTWRVDSAVPDRPLTRVGFARGLPEPKLKANVGRPHGKRKKGKGAKFKLAYKLRQIPGQKVTFTERGEGIAQQLGKARGGKGTISFKPTIAADRGRTIEAEVAQDGLPRELLTVARFKAPKQPKITKPSPKAKRKGSSLKLSWRKIRGAADYLVEVSAGAEILHRVVTPQPKLRLDGTPAEGKLRVTVQALGEAQPPGPVAKLTVKPPKKAKGKGKGK